MTCLVLASASTSRARVLSRGRRGVRRAARPYRRGRGESLAAPAVSAVAAELAELKALRVSASRPGDLVLGADQVLVCDGALLSKAETLADAAAQLTILRGKPHTLISALALARDGAVVWRHAEEARLRMRDFSDAFLESYLKAEGEEVLGSVGCYRLEGPGAQLFDRVEGDYFSILGLPLLPLLAVLRRTGCDRARVEACRCHRLAGGAEPVAAPAWLLAQGARHRRRLCARCRYGRRISPPRCAACAVRAFAA